MLYVAFNKSPIGSNYPEHGRAFVIEAADDTEALQKGETKTAPFRAEKQELAVYQLGEKAVAENPPKVQAEA